MWGRKAQRIAELERQLAVALGILSETRDALAVSELTEQQMVQEALRRDAEIDRLAALLAKELSK